MFSLLNKLNLFTNQKQPLNCTLQNSYLGFWENTLYTIWQGAHLLVKLQTGRTNKQIVKMKSLTGIFKALISVQMIHCRTTIFAVCLLMTASVLKHDYDIVIVKSAKSLKILWYEEVARWIEMKICWYCIIYEKSNKLLKARKGVRSTAISRTVTEKGIWNSC